MMWKMVWILMSIIIILGGFTVNDSANRNQITWNDIYFNDENGTYQDSRCYKCLYADAKVNPQNYVELNVADAIEYNATKKGIEVVINNQKFYQLNKDKISDKQNILGKFTNPAISEQFASGVYDENKLNNYQLYDLYQMEINLENNPNGNVIRYEDIDHEYKYKIKRVNGSLESQGFTIKDSGILKVDQEEIKQQLNDYLEINYQNIAKLEKEISKLEQFTKIERKDMVTQNQLDIQKLEAKISTLEVKINQLESQVSTPTFFQQVTQSKNQQQLTKLNNELKAEQKILVIINVIIITPTTYSKTEKCA